jgi:hypothetical protein
MYLINIACGDAFKAVTNQQVQVYDGTTFLKTLFTGAATTGADSYLDAQGNIFSAAAWPVANVPVTLIFQTTQVVFYIGDGVHATYIAAIQVQDAVQSQTIIRRRLKPLWRRTYVKRWFKRKLLPMPIVQPQRALVCRPKPRRISAHRLLHIRRRVLYPIAPLFKTPPKPARRRVWPRRKLRLLKRRLYVPVAFKPPLVIPWHPRPRVHIKRKWTQIHAKKYPFIGSVEIGGLVLPGAKIVVRVV